MRLPILDKRLKAIAEEVDFGCNVADIGTDHGLLIAHLAHSGKAVRGFACDINEKPLHSANITLQKFGVSDIVSTHLSNGLSALDSDKVDTVIIAGMGGDLILDILLASSWDFSKKKLILQPMTKAYRLRKGLLANGFTISKESPISVGRHVYSIMICHYTGEKNTAPLLYHFLGEIPKSTNENRDKYILMVRENLQTRINELKNTDRKLWDILTYQNMIDEIDNILNRGVI